MRKNEKERVVAELTERLRTSETLIVADYRGLTNAEIDGLRSKLIEHGARFSVVKNTLTRRAAEAAGADALLALLEGPSAIAFVECGGDPVAVAKALGDAATSTKVLAIRGGVLEGSRDVGGRGREPRQAAARRRAAGAAPRGDRLAADDGRRAGHGAAAGSRRADRRADRAAQGAGRHVRGRRARPRKPLRARAAEAEPRGRAAAEAEAEPEAEQPEARRAPKRPQTEETAEETTEETTDTQEEQE